MATEYAHTQPKMVIVLGNSEPINCLAFHGGFFLAGTVGLLHIYRWDEERTEMSEECSRIKIPSHNFESIDINYILSDKNNKKFIYAGCGDNMIYEIDLTSSKTTRRFSGHSDYIHCMAGTETNMLSASEDGSVLIWDFRINSEVGKIEPFKNTDLARPKFGKWQGTVSMTNDWFVCGGGPKSSIWHLRSLECMRTLPFPEKVHCCKLFEDLIIIGGEYQYLHQYNFNGDILSEVPTSGSSTYCIALQDKPIKVMSVAGASDCLDMFTNFNFRDMVVQLYMKE